MADEISLLVWDGVVATFLRRHYLALAHCSRMLRAEDVVPVPLLVERAMPMSYVRCYLAWVHAIGQDVCGGRASSKG